MAREWVTAAAILAQAGAPAAGVPTDWAELCAAAVNEGLDARLVGAFELEPDPLPAELVRAALTAGVVAYKAREANVDQSSPAGLVGDYLDTIEPILERYATTGIA